MLKDDGWYLVNIEGSHHQFKHPTKDIPPKTLKSNLQASWLGVTGQLTKGGQP